MIPYFTSTSFHLGPLTIYTWGTFVALGILVGTYVSARYAERYHIKHHTVYDDAFAIIISAFLGARIFHVALYAFDVYRHDLLGILKVWDGGWSSLGGITGAILASLWLIRKRGLGARYADALASGFPIGMAIGRIGCFLIHDHPGTLSDSLLAVKFPSGPRYDLGLLESLNMFALALACFLLRKRFEKHPGMLAAFIGAWYGITRFFLDFLRATDLETVDERYLGLTPAQYACLGLVVFAAYSLKRKKI